MVDRTPSGSTVRGYPGHPPPSPSHASSAAPSPTREAPPISTIRGRPTSKAFPPSSLPQSQSTLTPHERSRELSTASSRADLSSAAESAYDSDEGRRPPPAAPSSTHTRTATSSRIAPRSRRVEDDLGVDDDEDVPQDRGEALIRRRQRERKKEKRAKEKERARQSILSDSSLSVPPQPGPLGDPQRPTFPRQNSNRPQLDVRRPSLASSVASSATGTAGPSSPRVAQGQSWHGYFSEAEESDWHDRAPSRASTRVRDGDDEEAEILEGPADELGNEPEMHDDEEEDEEDDTSGEIEDITLKDRQDAINIEHPFGLPIWKPALYKKSRSVTRAAESALHAVPSALTTSFLLSNVLWLVLAGWWLSILCLIGAAIVYVAEGCRYGTWTTVLAGLGWYIVWPFGGKYVEGRALDQLESERAAAEDVDEEGARTPRQAQGAWKFDDDNGPPTAIRMPSTPNDESAGAPLEQTQTITPTGLQRHIDERTSLIDYGSPVGKGKGPDSYGATAGNGSAVSPTAAEGEKFDNDAESKVSPARIAFYTVLTVVVGPVFLAVGLLCYFFALPIPMGKLLFALVKHLWRHPTHVRFRRAPRILVPDEEEEEEEEGSGRAEEDGDEASSSTKADNGNGGVGSPSGTFKVARLTAGQTLPTKTGDTSTVLICTYRAGGLQYLKYTVGGVNILFVNLMPLVFLVIIDALVVLPYVERRHIEHGFLAVVASRAVIFVLALASVIPLSYFIGMAVASISAQSSIGVGAVINATFGSIIEILLYTFALAEGKSHLVEGSLVGSFLAGVLLMPGASMCSGALKRKEQRFNAKSAGVTSTMLIMAIIGTLTPTLFYQTYGSSQLVCRGCPKEQPSDQPWRCQRCYYQHIDPHTDPFYQENVKHLMYFCAAILVLSYLIGLWFSLRTHASQIWQNPQQLMQHLDTTGPGAAQGALGHLPPAQRASVYKRIDKGSLPTSAPAGSRQSVAFGGPSTSTVSPANRRMSVAPTGTQPSPVDHQPQQQQQQAATLQLPQKMTHEDFNRAVAAATASAMRQQQHARTASTGGGGAPGDAAAHGAGGEGHGGHDAPEWSRLTSASVLLACTALYAAIAEILVDVVDVVLEGSGIDEKFLGITLFALVPNTTEFMNAMSFAINGNIALSIEIGSAYALQVCLLQIPAMVAISAFTSTAATPADNVFVLIFSRWDAIAFIFSVFLLTYVMTESRSNYYRGSILILSYLVLVSGFYFAPSRNESHDDDVTYVGGTSKSSLATLGGAPCMGPHPELPFWQAVQAQVLSLFIR